MLIRRSYEDEVDDIRRVGFLRNLDIISRNELGLMPLGCDACEFSDYCANSWESNIYKTKFLQIEEQKAIQVKVFIQTKTKTKNI